MVMIEAYQKGWKRSFEYGGRSNRGDYWWFVLANLIVVVLLSILAGLAEPFWKLLNVYIVAQIIPHLPLTIRRLRDGGHAWPWIFIGLVPVIGSIWLLVLLVLPSMAG